MATARDALEQFSSNLDESMGVRRASEFRQLSPSVATKDVGRRPLRNIGSIDINMVLPDPDQPRAEFADDGIEHLAQSIRDRGQFSPIRVRWSNEHEKWVIVSGERRWRATMQAGLKMIDCHFHHGDLGQSEIVEQQLIENCLRQDLQPIEEATAFAKLMHLNHWNAKQLSEALRISPTRISRSLALFKLPRDLKEQVASGQLPSRTAYELSKLQNADTRRELAQEFVASRPTHEHALRAIRQRRGKQGARPRGTRQTFLTETGWKVVVSANKRGTYHEMEQSLQEAIEEVRHRIANNIQIF